MSTADPGHYGPVGATGHTGEELQQESFGELLSGLATDMSTLVKQEIELAKIETTAKVKTAGKAAGKGVGLLVAAGVFGLLALMVLTTLLIVILDAFLPLWLAVLIVLVLWSVVAAVLALQGKKKLKDVAAPVPTEAIDTVKEDVAWAKHPTSSART